MSVSSLMYLLLYDIGLMLGYLPLFTLCYSQFAWFVCVEIDGSIGMLTY